MSEKNEKRNTVLKDIEGKPMVFGQSDALKYTPYVGTAKEVLDAAIARGDLYYIDPNNKIYPEQSTNRQNEEGWNEKMAEKRKAYEDDLYNTYKRGISKAPGNVIFGAEAPAVQSPTLPESVAYLDGTMPNKVVKPTVVPTATKEGAPAAKAETTEHAAARKPTNKAVATATEEKATDAEAPKEATSAQTPAVKKKVPVATTQTPAPAAQTAVEDVQQNEDGGKMTILWPERPEMEKGNYVEQTDAQIAQAQKSAAEQERRAKRDRDMAILSDIANLVTKGAAMHGGAWKIDKEEARSAVANEKLRALRESNSKLLAEYARRRMEAADADRKERNAAAKAEYDAEVDKAKLQASIARTDAELKEKERHQKVLEDIAWQNSNTRKTEAENKGKGGGKSTTGGSGSEKVKDIYYIGDLRFDYNDDKDVVKAYTKMVQADRGKIVTEEVVTSRGRKIKKEVSNPSVNQMRSALVNGGMTKEPKKNGTVAGYTTASPLNKGKNSNNKKDTGSW